VGVLGVLTGIIGTMMANEVIKIILKFSDVLSGVLLCYDSRTTNISKLIIDRNQSEINHIINQTALQEIQVNTQCEPLLGEITELNNLILNQIEFIDVREKHETPKIMSLKYKQVPLGQIKEHIDIIDSNKKIVVFCQSGIRSKKAVELLRDSGITNAVSFKGGVMNMITNIKNIKNVK
jgi:adenylyltransferase/sulfurtransferase